jgi:hypothetical protein
MRGASRLIVAAIVDLQAPQAIDRDGAVVRIEQVAEETPAHRVERRDRSAESIADQQVMAEEAEVLRRQGNAPGCAQPRTAVQETQEPALGGENSCKTTFLASIVVLGSFARVLFCLRHDDI